MKYQRRIDDPSCILCNRRLPITSFYTKVAGGSAIDWRCKECSAKRRREIYIKKRKDVFDHYGWECKCCGETESAFLTIDHIDSNGAKQRRKHGACQVDWIIRLGFPEGLQTLCYNCNCAKQYNKGCPHQLKKGVQEVLIADY